MPRWIQIGLGPLGRQVVADAMTRNNRGPSGGSAFELVGAVDINPELAGRDAGELCGGAPLGVPVVPSLDDVPDPSTADAAILTTVSGIAVIVPQVEAAARAGLNVVSTCEELSFPWRTAPDAARAIDTVCRAQGVTCLGTGVNPGFLMDLLPLVLTAPCRRVDRVLVERIQDASHRRVPFQQKIGAGLTPDAFDERKRAGTLRHVGLGESMDMIAHRMGWSIDRTDESLEPVLAATTVSVGHVPIEPGMARGVEQIARAWVGDAEVIRLVFRAAVGEPRSVDLVRLDGDPSIESRIDGGVNGDVATCAIVLNAVPVVAAAPPGLKTMADLQPVTCVMP